MERIIVAFGLYFLVSCSLATADPDIAQLEVTPNHPIYKVEDNVTLNCCSADSESIKLFEFYKKGIKIHSAEWSKRCGDFLYEIRTKEDGGPFQCLYSALQNGTYVQSNISVSITIQIAETPQPPSIILTPSYTIYTKQESITLTCLPPTGASAKGIQIYQDDKKIYEDAAMNNNINITVLIKDAPGKYACRYWTEINERAINSSQSDYIIVNVTDIPAAPSVSVRPLFPVYIRGDYVNITCSLPYGTESSSIDFYKDQQKITLKTQGTMQISTADSTATEKYSCQYSKEILGRKIKSIVSDEVTIRTTEVPPAPTIILNPILPVYIKGETISITCIPSDELEVTGIQYFKDDQQVLTPGDSLTIPSCSEKNDGRYSCGFWVNHSGRQIFSQKSSTVAVKVVDLPDAPFLQLMPNYSFYVSGETVNLQCTGSYNGQDYKIYKNGHLLKQTDSSGRTLSHLLESLKPHDNGSYTCTYELNITGRMVKSLTSMPVNVHVIDVPPAPSIILNSLLPVYIRGESIRIKCSPPDGLQVTGIQYFKDDQHLLTLDNSETMFSYTIFSCSHENIGKYSCGFWIYSQREIYSQRSLTVAVKVRDPLDAPVLNLMPIYHLYVAGETLQMQCVGSSGARNHKICKNGHLLMQSDSSERIYSHTIEKLKHNDNGNYTCTYHLNFDGRMVESPSSLHSNLRVIDLFPAPNLTLGFPVEELDNGFMVTLNCSVPDSDLMKNFYYTKASDGHSERIVTDYSASLKWELGLVSHANFYCEYEEVIAGRNIRSRKSNTLTITLAEPSALSPPMIAGIIGAVSLVLCIGLVLLFYARYKREFKHRRLNFSWYWKTPKTVPKESFVKVSKSMEEINMVQERPREVSRNPSRLSITTVMDDNTEDNAVNLTTFQINSGQGGNIRTADCVWNSTYM